MKNKRLLIILCVFIVVGSVAIFGSAVFSINSITVNFHNDLDYFIKDGATEEERRAAEARLENEIRASLHFMMGRNILFNMDENRIRNTVENTERNPMGGGFEGFRLRVTNVEAVFPNRIIVTVRERYPVFTYTDGSNVVVMDGSLRVLDTRLPPPRIVNGIPVPRDVVSLNYVGGSGRVNIFQNTNISTVEVGGYLTSEYPGFDDFKNALQRIVPVFARLENREDAVTHIFERIEFVYRYGQDFALHGRMYPTLVLVQRVPARNAAPMNYFVVYIIDANVRTEDKILLVWDIIRYRRLVNDIRVNGIYTVLSWSGHHGWLNRVPPRGLIVEYVLPNPNSTGSHDLWLDSHIYD